MVPPLSDVSVEESPSRSPTPRSRRLFFAALDSLLGWHVPTAEALPIAAQAAGSPALTDRALGLQASLQQGLTLTQAFERERAFWGERTVRIISRSGEHHPRVAFRRLAAGAAEHPLSRPFISCFGMGWRRRLISAAAVLGVAALFLPVLPHFEDETGRLWVVPFPQFPFLAASRNPYATLGRGWLRGSDPQWKQFRDLSALMDTPGISGALQPEVERRLALWLESSGPVGVQARYIQTLKNVIGDRQTVGCFLEMRRHLYEMAYAVEASRGLDQLIVSPVPLIWLQRALHVEPLRESLLLSPGDAKQRLLDLAGRCPSIRLLTPIPASAELRRGEGMAPEKSTITSRF